MIEDEETGEKVSLLFIPYLKKISRSCAEINPELVPDTSVNATRGWPKTCRE